MLLNELEERQMCQFLTWAENVGVRIRTATDLLAFLAVVPEIVSTFQEVIDGWLIAKIERERFGQDAA